MTALESLAERYRLKIRRDECGDPIIPGRRGHLYCDAGRLCLMMLNARPVQPRRLRELVRNLLGDGTFWQGDISRTPEGRRAQDLQAWGLPPKAAIKLAGVKRRRVLSESQAVAGAERLAAARAARRIAGSTPRTQQLGLEMHGKA